MIVWLDHKIFGNGRGLGSPFHDSKFYWLVDTYRHDRPAKNGELYKYSAGFGAQLSSFQWTHPKAGERRRLIGREFKPFSSYRSCGRVSVSWALVGMPPHDIDGANAMLRALERDLNSVLMEPRHD